MSLNLWLLISALIALHANSLTEARYVKPTQEDDYWTRREAIIAGEASIQLGASIVLNSDEERANQVLMDYKTDEFDAGFEDPSKYLAARHFFEVKDAIKQSEVFKILQKMPKGGLLHTHNTATASFDYVYNLTHRDNLYVCRDESHPSLKFFAVPDNKCNWELVSHLRETEGDNFEKYLVEHMTLVREDYEEVYTDINKIWSKFEILFDFISDLIRYRPILEEHFHETLNQLYRDNITYVEIRGTLSKAYGLDGTIYTQEQLVQMHIDVAERFKAEHPNFIGVKMIYAPYRGVDDSSFDQYMQNAENLKTKFPNFISGFDVVGQEDLGRPLKDFVDKLLTMDVDFFFHAGETNWYQGLTDQNLIDAILLGTRRIGHGYAAVKHPYIMQKIAENNIAIEVAPLSNQVLMLVRDMRNHPASIFMAENIPMVITNDDPTFWGAEGVSYDWYMAFMGIAGRNADLKLLKQLAINSLTYSSMSHDEKVSALDKWTYDWDQFIHNVLQEYKH